jgi:branched-subunit amino acid aminotransferase/4-amino-4-deoxychorismate lyase
MSPERRFGPGANTPEPHCLQNHLPRTALPVRQGHPCHLAAHLARLQAGAVMLGQPSSWVEGRQEELREWLHSATHERDAALRLVLHPAASCFTARLEPLPSTPSPYRLVPLPHPLNEGRSNPQAPHKGLSGPWSAAVRAEAHRLGGEDALLLWPDGTLAETAIAAVGLEVTGFLLVPPPEGRVASLAERLDLPAWCEARGLRIVVAPIPASRVTEGRLWCMNALRGIWSSSLL